MFDFDATKLLIVGVIALICIPPKDLPRAMRQAGQFVGKMRRMAADFQSQFMDAMREADMADVRREAQKLAESARVDVGLHDVEHSMTAKTKLTDESVTHEAPQVTTSDVEAEHAASDVKPAPDIKSASVTKSAPAEPASHSV